MGNTKSQKLKESYIKGKYNVKESRKDQLLGLFSVLQFYGYDNDMHIQKVLNPAEYDEYADINEFIKKLSNSCKNICEFYFVEYNTQNQDLFDLVFEFGSPMALPFESEKHIWSLIEQLTDGMLFLEDNVLHYPFLHKNYIVQTGDRSFKLVNPYCFPDYLKEVLQIYMNPMNPVSNRKIYSQTQIKRNIKEFAVLIITLIQSHSVQRLLREPSYWQEVLLSMRGMISAELERFIAFILQQNPSSPQSFQDLKTWLNTYKPNSSVTKVNIFAPKQTTPKKPSSLTPSQNRKMDVFETPNNNNKVLSSINLAENSIESNRNINPNQLNQFYQDDLSRAIKKSSSSKDLYERSPADNPKPRPPVIENITDYGFQLENKYDNANTDHRRESVIMTPLINSSMRGPQFDFINHAPSPNKSINSYFQNQKDVRETVLSDYYLDDLNTKEEVNVINFNQPAPQEPNPIPLDGRKESLPEISQTPQPKMVKQLSLSLEESKPLSLSPTNTTKVAKKINRVLIKWVREENKYQKTIEYTDGTSEVVPMDNEEDNTYKQFSSKYIDKPQSPVPSPNITPIPNPITSTPIEKASHMAFYDIKNINTMNKSSSFISSPENLMIMMLYRDIAEPPLLLFKTQSNRDAGYYYNVASVVDQSHPVKPSMYHQIEDDPTVEVNRLKNSYIKPIESSDKKQPVIRSVNEISALNDTNVSMPTSFGVQRRVMIQRKAI